MIEGLVPAQDALKMVLQGATHLGTETVKLSESCGRVLAQDLTALRTQPPFDASAMDGYAVRQIDVANLPAKLKVIGQSAAGHPFDQEVGVGEAVRIFTGAPIPAGADTIIIQEDSDIGESVVQIFASNPAGKFVRKAGLDFSEGEILLTQHHVLNPQTVSLAASMNHATLKVWAKPVVAIIATGDELVRPGNKLKPGQIITSNSYALCALAEQAGARVLDLGIARDQLDDLKNLAQSAIDQGADVIITMGGASVGDHDLVRPVMGELGFDFQFVKVAMRPGKPFLFARKTVAGKTIFLLGLAGNPVSSMVAGQVFVRPLINALAGLPPNNAGAIPARLGRDVPANDQRQEYMRARLSKNSHGTLIVDPFESQDSSMLANLTRSDCLLIRPINAPAAKAGEDCEIVMLD